jgi:multidrug resistance efflux pump
MDLNFLSQADNVALKYELAKAALETAKNNLEAAKQAYDDLLAQADTHGIPKAKLKKLTEDRVQALLESGLVPAAKADGGKAAEGKRGKKAPKTEAVSESAANDNKAEAAAEHAGDEDGLSLIESDDDLGEARA